MAVSYTLHVTDLSVLPEYGGYSDIVCAVNWAYIGTDGVFSSQVVGSTPLNLDLGYSTIPLTDLTEATVLSWVNKETDPQVWITAQAQIEDWLRGQYADSAVTIPPPWIE